MRCLAMPCRVIGSRVARSVAVAGPLPASSVRIARRLGSAKATKTCSAIASRSRGIVAVEVAGELVELGRPAVGVAAERLAVNVVGQLSESGLDDRQSCAGRCGLQRELDIGPAYVVLGQAVNLPGETEDAWFFHSFDAHVLVVAVAEVELSRAAGAKVDGRSVVAEPRGQALGGGERRPDSCRRVRQLDRALDPIRESHDASRASSNRSVAKL